MSSRVVTIGGQATLPMEQFFDGRTATHDYDGAHVDWTLTGDENERSILSVTNADQAVSAIATPTDGKLLLVRNACGFACTVKASGQSGVACANGTLTWLLANGTDFVSTDQAAAITATTSAEGVVELATAAEVLACADTGRAVVPATNGLSNTVRHTGSEAVTAAQMHGQTHIVTSAATLTLPTVAAGLNATFVTIGAIAVSIKAGASDKITLKDTALDDGDKVTNGSTDMDTLQILANAAGTDWETGWISGTWTDGGA